MAIEIKETFYPKTRKSWRSWLSKNHDKKTEIWVIYYKKHTNTQTVSYQDAVDEALCFGWIDGMDKRMDEDRYAQRFTPRTSKSSWSETNVARYKLLLKEGLMTKAGTEAFEKKLEVYSPKMLAKGRIWHETHKMPKSPTLEERIAWHKEHKVNCGCRPLPKSLEKYFN